MKNKYSLFFFLIIYVPVFAQQGNNWYFGERAGITFNTTPPSALTNGALSTAEGCATISDSTGQLLFYTDGSSVYNRNHEWMPNGSGVLGGHPSSTNSAIVVRKPGSDSLYYIFTVDAAENQFRRGYSYSIVDMSLDGGLGDVTGASVLLYAPSSEKITAVSHADGIAIWIVTKDHVSNTYKVFKLDCNGVDLSPVISNVGIPYPPGGTRVGSIKASPDGTKIASARWSFWELFKFDRTTGQLYDPICITPRPSCGIFGVEFSPSSDLAYIALEDCFNSAGQIFQYKVDIWDSAIISNSYYKVDSSTHRKGDMQLGADGKIYVPNELDTTLNSIQNPDFYGIACNYSFRNINLTSGRRARRCLPAFFRDNISNSNVDFTYTVSPDCSVVTFYGTTNLPLPIEWFWDFGDGNTATGQVVSHVFGNNNNYTVSLSVNNPNVCGAKGKKIRVLSRNTTKPVSKFGFITACEDSTVIFQDSSFISSGNIISWLWDFGDGQTSTLRNPRHTYGQFGQYMVKLKVISAALCPMADSISKTVLIIPKQNVSFTFDKACIGQPVQFTGSTSAPNSEILEWIWDFGDGQLASIQNPQHVYLNSNTYNASLIVKLKNGCISVPFIKTITVKTKPVADFIFEPGCAGVPVNFTDRSSLPPGEVSSSFWNYGNGNNSGGLHGSSTYSTPGNYFVKHVVSAGNCPSDTISRLVVIEDRPVALFRTEKECGSKLVLFKDESVITAGNIVSWAWDFGDTNTSVQNNPGHAYTNFGSFTTTLTVSTINGCKSIPLIKVVPVFGLSIFAGNDTAILAGRPTQLNVTGMESYSWSPSRGLNFSTIKDPITTLQADITYFIRGMNTDGCTAFDTLVIKVFKTPDIYVPSAFTPNGDGLNDHLGPYCVGIKQIEYFRIYNRWGRLVFSTTALNGRWNPDALNERYNTGTFVWTVKAITFDGRIITQSGTSILMR